MISGLFRYRVFPGRREKKPRGIVRKANMILKKADGYGAMLEFGPDYWSDYGHQHLDWDGIGNFSREIRSMTLQAHAKVWSLGDTLDQGARPMHELEAIIHAADEAINREDLDALMDFYSEEATLVVRPGLNATGKDQIRKAFAAIADHFNHTLHVTQDHLVVIEGGATALVLGKAEIRAKDPAGAQVLIEREATYVFMRDGGGAWRCAVDNSYGTSLLRE